MVVGSVHGGSTCSANIFVGRLYSSLEMMCALQALLPACSISAYFTFGVHAVRARAEVETLRLRCRLQLPGSYGIKFDASWYPPLPGMLWLLARRQ